MGLRDQVKTLLWQHGVENDAVLDALDWKMRKIMDENTRLREALIETLAIATRNEEGGFADRARAALAKEAGE